MSQVNVPSSSGDFGILPNHVPALSTLKPGVVSVFETADAEKKFFGKAPPHGTVVVPLVTCVSTPCVSRQLFIFFLTLFYS